MIFIQIFLLIILQFFPIKLPTIGLYGKVHRIIPLFLIYIYPFFAGLFLKFFLAQIKKIFQRASFLSVTIKINRRKYQKYFSFFIIACVLLSPMFVAIQFYGKPQYNEEELDALNYLISFAETGSIVLNDYMAQWLPTLTREKNILITYPFMTASEDYTQARGRTLSLFLTIIKSDINDTAVYDKLKSDNISYIIFNTYDENPQSIRKYLNDRLYIQMDNSYFDRFPFLIPIYNQSEIFIYKVEL